MSDFAKRTKKIQGYTTPKMLYAIQQIQHETGVHMSGTLHNALVEYMSTHGALQMILKQENMIEKFNTKIINIQRNTTKINIFSDFETCFISSCVNLNDFNHKDLIDSPLIEDMITLMVDIKEFNEDEYEKCTAIGRKILKKKIYNLIIKNEPMISDIMQKERTEKERDRKELSIGQFNDKYEGEI